MPVCDCVDCAAHDSPGYMNIINRSLMRLRAFPFRACVVYYPDVYQCTFKLLCVCCVVYGNIISSGVQISSAFGIAPPAALARRNEEEVGDKEVEKIHTHTPHSARAHEWIVCASALMFACSSVPPISAGRHGQHTHTHNTRHTFWCVSG